MGKEDILDFINKIFFELFTLKKPFSYKTIRRYKRKPFNLSTSGTSHSPACGILPLVETFTPHSSHFTYQKAAIGIIRDVGKACFSDTLLAGFAFAHTARMRKSAFTLAEVLITLGIIGVVASMTLPTLVNKYQKQETVARLSAAYSLVSQAIKRSEVDNGALDYWNFELDSQTFSDKYIKPYFQVIASYKAEDVPKNVHNYCMNGTNCDSYFDYFDLPKIIIKNGTALSFRTTASGDGTRFLTVVADLNGFQKPNTYGKDLFAFSVAAGGKMVPYGVGDILGGTTHIGYDRDELANGSDNRACNKSKGGAFCAALIIMDGWKISDDYPW